MVVGGEEEEVEESESDKGRRWVPAKSVRKYASKATPEMRRASESKVQQTPKFTCAPCLMSIVARSMCLNFTARWSGV